MKILLLVALLPLLTFASPKTVGELPVPHGCVRVPSPPGSYAAWLPELPVKKIKTIAAFDGSIIDNPGYHVFAVLDLPLLFRQDLEQCADFSFRLWAEYHKSTNRLDSLYLFDYNGKKKYFRNSRTSFNSFLKQTIANANSYSVKKGGIPVRIDELQPGDMFVQNENGGIGHVSVIMDMCESPEKERFYLVGFSFMPAQEFHIEYAQDEFGTGGWFSFEGFKLYLSQFLSFGEPVMRRFGQ